MITKLPPPVTYPSKLRHKKVKDNSFRKRRFKRCKSAKAKEFFKVLNSYIEDVHRQMNMVGDVCLLDLE